MSSNIESVRVGIFGAEYSIKSDVDTATTREIARYVNSKMTDIHNRSSSRDHMKIAVLSALNITGELFECREKCNQHEQTIRELHERIESLTHQIHSALTH
jgi:cell division protein ZapA (FtsZ GTPase activity inhibitor)